ncbi:hypothetical protein BDQ17DRAFT_1361524 [Cyathus striatus]|nr:hypothetical protein BDQ17DRAFT_1361524 [Cyathus striatus]
MAVYVSPFLLIFYLSFSALPFPLLTFPAFLTFTPFSLLSSSHSPRFLTLFYIFVSPPSPLADAFDRYTVPIPTILPLPRVRTLPRNPAKVKEKAKGGTESKNDTPNGIG